MAVVRLYRVPLPLTRHERARRYVHALGVMHLFGVSPHAQPMILMPAHNFTNKASLRRISALSLQMAFMPAAEASEQGA